MLSTDTLGRRYRFREPNSRGKRIEVSERDLDMLVAIHRHGPLPTKYLFHFYGTKKYQSFQYRLCRLYDGSETVPGLLDRPHDYRSPEVYGDQCVYSLTAAGEYLIETRGLLSPHIKRKDQALHRFMGACVGASFELAAHGIEYLSRHQILSDERCKRKDLSLDVGNVYEPDELFGLRINGRPRFFICEWDRNTEVIKKSKSKRETIEDKLEAASTAIAKRSYFHQWGIPNARFLFATTTVGGIETLRNLVNEKYPNLKGKIFFKPFLTFGSYWRVPNSPFTDIFEWIGTDGETVDIKTTP